MIEENWRFIKILLWMELSSQARARLQEAKVHVNIKQSCEMSQIGQIYLCLKFLRVWAPWGKIVKSNIRTSRVPKFYLELHSVGVILTQNLYNVNLTQRGDKMEEGRTSL